MTQQTSTERVAAAMRQLSERARIDRLGDRKYIYLDSSKFGSQGEEGFRVRDLLDTAHSVTIYTVATPANPQDDKWIMATFKKCPLSHEIRHGGNNQCIHKIDQECTDQWDH
jgi:hypothetical protein